MAALTPAITSSNCLEVVRLNRSISICLVILNLLTSSRALADLHNSISTALLRRFSSALFSASNNAVLDEGEGAPVGRNDRKSPVDARFLPPVQELHSNCLRSSLPRLRQSRPTSGKESPMAYTSGIGSWAT